jgi:hypothetical protein
MTHPSVCTDCGNAWYRGHKTWCPTHQRALQRRENHARAVKLDQETRRVDVLPRRPIAPVIPLRSRDGRCPVHPSEDSVFCIHCADMDVDA